MSFTAGTLQRSSSLRVMGASLLTRERISDFGLTTNSPAAKELEQRVGGV
jgi:hypothetical protein